MVSNVSKSKSSSENGSGDEQTGSDKFCVPNLHKNQNQKDENPIQQDNSSQSSNGIPEDNPDVLLKMLVQAFKKLWQHVKVISLFIMNDLGGYQLFDRVAQWCVQHPQMAICILAAGLVAFLPILLFFAFALSTIVMTFTGFLVLEGTLLTILTMIMCGLLGALVVVLLFFVLVGVATYFGVSHVYDMYGSTELQRTVLRNFMQRSNRRTSNENITRNIN